jgi:hypothetical protein
MCSPLIASTIIGAAGTASSLIGQRQQAQAHAESQRLASMQERQRYLAEVSAMRTQEQQEDLGRTQQKQQAAKKAMEARATATVSAGEAGVSGLSVDALLGDITRQQAEFNFSSDQQARLTSINRGLMLNEAGMGFNRNMLRINQPIEQPNYLGSVMGGTQTGLSTYGVLEDSGLFG